MDRISDTITTFVVEFTADDLRDPVVNAASARLVDSVGCAIAAIDSEPARIARRIASATRGAEGATVLGLPDPTTADLAAFANTVMVRFLDCNDMGFTARGGGGHPSDLVPVALATGDATGATGAEVLRSIVLGYEVNNALASAVWLRERGWDQGLNIVAAAAMMAGALYGLSREALGHALSLAVTPNVPVRQTRVGHLSMWKGCATAGAARNGIFAALLAREGMTGPPRPYEGASGIWEQVTGPFDVALPVSSEQFAIETTAIKTRPAEYNAQGPIDLMLELRPHIALDDVVAIELDTYYLAWHEIGSDAAKWGPTTRETADHSLPYLLAVALLDGDVWIESCSPERIADPAIKPLMDRISIRERPDFTERFPSELPNELRIRLRDGRELRAASVHPRGHARNPLGAEDINAKFERLIATRPAADREIALDVRSRLWALRDTPSIKPVLGPLAALGTADPAVATRTEDSALARA